MGEWISLNNTMNSKTLTYSLIFVMVIISGALGSFAALNMTKDDRKAADAVQDLPPIADRLLAASATPISTPAADQPTTISIPAINVSTKIEHVGLDDQRRMDVPQDVWNVAWYRLGARPGEIGNAAIAGHLDSTTGPAVFYDLEKLKQGDEITVTDVQNSIHRFKVTRVVTYEDDQFPINEVFGPAGKARLNLITCEGVFNESTKNYSHRVVVYSEKI